MICSICEEEIDDGVGCGASRGSASADHFVLDAELHGPKCNHHYHMACMLAYQILKGSTLCPVCYPTTWNHGRGISRSTHAHMMNRLSLRREASADLKTYGARYRVCRALLTQHRREYMAIARTEILRRVRTLKRKIRRICGQMTRLRANQSYLIDRLCYRCARSDVDRVITIEGPSSEECAICQEVSDAACARLVCGHRFHAKCISGWFQHHMNCPLCRVMCGTVKFYPENNRLIQSEFARDLRTYQARLSASREEMRDLRATELYRTTMKQLALVRNKYYRSEHRFRQIQRLIISIAR